MVELAKHGGRLLPGVSSHVMMANPSVAVA